MFRRSVLIIALLFCLPTLWEALIPQTTTWEDVGIRFLIALPVAGILVSLVRLASHPQEEPAKEDAGSDVTAISGGTDRMSDD